METYLIILIAVVAPALVLAAFFLGRRGGSHLLMQRQNEALRAEIKDSLASTTSLVNEQMARMSEQVSGQLANVSSQMQANSGQLNDRMEHASRIVGEVREGIGSLSKATEQVFNVGKDIASLQEILKAPKLRGNLGEFFLGDLLAQILPRANFDLQYGFKSGARVDAVIRLAGGSLVPVDSKFPMENFRRILDGDSEDEKRAARRKFAANVKKHIDDIAAAYIVPDEGTLSFALMYIPAENVFYETIIKESDESGAGISAYAFSKRVVPVSPNSFYAYLQTILMGLRGLEVSKRAGNILAHLERLSGDFDRLSEDFEVIGTHLNNARTRHDTAGQRMVRFSERLKGLGDSEG